MTVLEPHSLQRYIFFGAVAGVISGVVSAVSEISLPLIAIPLAAVAGWFAGAAKPIARY